MTSRSFFSRLSAVAAAVCLTTTGCSTAKETEARLNGQASCPMTPDTGRYGSVRMAYQLIPNADLVVKDQHWMEACLPNTRIEWIKADSGGSVIRALGAHSIDLGTIGSSPASRVLSPPLATQTLVKVIWVQDIIGEAESLVARDRSITAIDGLAGKTIAVPFASTAHYSLLAALDRAGLTGKRAPKLINLEPDAIRAAWMRGDIDAAWVWNPVLSDLTASGGRIIVTAAQTAKAGAPTYDLTVVTSRFSADHPEVIGMWGKLQDVAVRQVASDPASASSRIAAQLGVPTGDARRQMGGLILLDASHQASRAYFGGGLGDDLARTAAFLRQQDEIQATAPRADYLAAIDDTAVKAAQQGR